MRRQADQPQDIVDVRRQRNRRPGQQLVEQDLHRVEPVQRARGRAVGDALVVVALAEVPQPDLVEIVEAERAREGVDEDDVAGARRDDVGQVEGEEVGAADAGLIGCVAD